MDKYSTVAIIDKKIADKFRKLVREKNAGRIHGMVRPEFKRAIENHIKLMEMEVKK